MSSEFNGSFEDYLNSPLDLDLVNGDSSGSHAPFLYRYGDRFPWLDIEPAAGTVENEALKHLHHPFQEEHISAGAEELGVEPNQVVLQDTGFDADASYNIGQSDYDLQGVDTSTNDNSGPLDRESLRCPWTNCTIGVSSHSKEGRNLHFEDHRSGYNWLTGEWSRVPEKWPPSTTCNWPKCSSKAVFKTPGSYETHLENIHARPLVCDVPECSYTKPFGKGCDLIRHKSTAHGDAGQIECPAQGCDTKARKDKLQEHMRKYHQKLRCPYNHCNATVIEGQEEAHMRDGHGAYECGLGACEAGLKSCFLLNRLKHHVRYQHGVCYYDIDMVTSDLEDIPDETLRASIRLRKLRSNKDCKGCLAKRVQD